MRLGVRAAADLAPRAIPDLPFDGLKVRKEQKRGFVQVVETGRYFGISLLRWLARIIERKLKTRPATNGRIVCDRLGQDQLGNAKRKIARTYGRRLCVDEHR